MRSTIVMGTRPEIIKMAPVIRQLGRRGHTIIFTRQHYDYGMGLRFIEQMGIRNPEYTLELPSENPVRQIGHMISRLADILADVEPDTTIVQGDTNTTLAAALASIKSGIPVSHVESGARSGDWRMPEEHNRIATDHIAETLFAPSRLTRDNLLSERVHGKVHVTGNTAIDSIAAHLKDARKRDGVEMNGSALLTLHRAENVDDGKTLAGIVNALTKSRLPTIFPLHPRTAKRLKEFGLHTKIVSSGNVKIIEPVGYLDILRMMMTCSFILTDSGGIQQEATSPHIRKKVLVLRKTTDSPEAVSAGFSELVGTKQTDILRAIRRACDNPMAPKKASPYGRGDAGKKISNILMRVF